jgi:hypothetical protein
MTEQLPPQANNVLDQAHLTPEAPVLPIENLEGNLVSDSYWQTVPEFAGSEYRDVVQQNQQNVQQFHDVMIGRGTRKWDGEEMTPAHGAVEWYYTLGTHNSLYGARDDLIRGAATIGLRLTRAEASQDHNQDFLMRVNRDEKFLAHQPERATLAAQMLIDAVHDPKTYGTAERDLSFRLGLLDTARRLASRVQGSLLETAKHDHMTPENQAAYSDALKFDMEARFMRLSILPDSEWQARYVKLQQQAVAEGPKSRAAKFLERVSDSTELRDHAMLSESLKQVGEVRQAAKYFTNGELNEHYFNLLLRHLVLSKDAYAVVSSATDRQDKPHDKLKPRGLPTLSHDAIVREYQPNRTLYVQLKAGAGAEAKAEGHYHPDIVIVNPFGELEDGAPIRADAEKGLTELAGALQELVTFTPYHGKTTTLERHVATVKQAFKQHLAK